MPKYLRSLVTMLLVYTAGAAVVFFYFAYIDRQTFDANKAFWRTMMQADWITYSWIMALLGVVLLGLAWYYSRSLYVAEQRLQAGELPADLPGHIRRRAATYPLIIALICLVAWLMAGLFYARGGLPLLAPHGWLPWPGVETMLRVILGLVLLTGLTAYTLVSFLLDCAAQQPRLRRILIVANIAGWLLAAWLFDRGTMMPPPIETFWRTFIGLSVVGGLSTSALIFLTTDAFWRWSLPCFFPTGNLAQLRAPRVSVGARLFVITLLTGMLPLLVLSMAVIAGAANLEMIVQFVAVVGIGSTLVFSLLTARSLLQPLRDLTVALDTANQTPGSLQMPPRLSNDELGDLTTHFRRQIEANNQLLAENIRLESALSIQNLEQQVAERTAELARAKEDAEAARQQAEAANAAKGAFLAMISHEIRTPMNAIIGMTSLLLNTPLNSDQSDFARTIRNSGETLLTIINDILDFSKIEANRLELEIQPFDLRDCIEDVLDLLATRVTDKGLDLAYVINAGVPEAIFSDETRLRQILINLLNNAIKFTHTGEITVTVDSQQLAGSYANGDSLYELHVAVRDTGIGIPPDRMDRLFQAFSQVDASTTRRYGGTGLGLVISQRLSELMGGRIRVESVVGQGSTFHFSIQARSAGPSRHAYLHQVQDQLAGKRMLIVDDNSTNRRILHLHAHTWGMLTQETADPNQALAWFQQGERFDFVILDMQMPDIDGLTLAAHIQASTNPPVPPIIMLTSLGGRSLTGYGEAATVELAAFLTRPIKPAQLFNVLVNLSTGTYVEPVTPEQVSTDQNEAHFDAQIGQHHPLRILLAEDNATNQKLMLHFLQQIGYTADIAANGIEALDALQRQTYDVILLDVNMPEMDGLETARRIVSTWPVTERPYMIAMTASAMPGDREMCLQAGMHEYVSKPIRLPTLVAALEHAIATPRSDEATVPPATVSSPPADQNGAILPPDAIQRLLADIGHDSVFLHHLIEVFLADSTRLLNDLRQGWATGDIEQVQRAAHTLKSNAAEFRATSVAQLCSELEILCRQGSLDGALDYIEQIETRYPRLQTELKTALATFQA